MSYHVDADTMSLEQLRKRLEGTDLIPSQQPLLDGIAKRFAALKTAGIKSVATLRVRLKNAKALAALATESDIDPEYLTLLRRAVEGFFPKPQPLSAFDWLEPSIVAKLEKAGVADTKQLFEATTPDISAFAKKSGLSKHALKECVALADLSRVQWVSPTFARVLVAAGYARAAQVAKAKPDALYNALLKANEGATFYKGKIGQRDIKRLIAAAELVG